MEVWGSNPGEQTLYRPIYYTAYGANLLQKSKAKFRLRPEPIPDHVENFQHSVAALHEVACHIILVPFESLYFGFVMVIR